MSGVRVARRRTPPESRTAPLIAAGFVSRPNRFIVVARLRSGRDVRAHLADPGRLAELLLPGAPLRLRPAPPGGARATRYTASLVRSPEKPREWVSLETTRANDLAAGLIETENLPGIGRPAEVRREATVGGSRFDFLLTDGRGRPHIIEVKSVTLVEEGRALFPDAPTARGTRHLRELARASLAGTRATVLFVVQRGDARSVSSNPRTDPEFARALREARADGVRAAAVMFRMMPSGRACYEGRLPVRRC